MESKKDGITIKLMGAVNDTSPENKAVRALMEKLIAKHGNDAVWMACLVRNLGTLSDGMRHQPDSKARHLLHDQLIDQLGAMFRALGHFLKVPAPLCLEIQDEFNKVERGMDEVLKFDAIDAKANGEGGAGMDEAKALLAKVAGVKL